MPDGNGETGKKRVKKVAGGIVGTRPGEATACTGVCASVTLLIPIQVERDRRWKPEDAVQLTSSDKAFDKPIACNDDKALKEGQVIEPGKRARAQGVATDWRKDPLFFLKFKGVPPGIYTVALRLGDKSYTFTDSLKVTLEGCELKEMNPPEEEAAQPPSGETEAQEGKVKPPSSENKDPDVIDQRR